MRLTIATERQYSKTYTTYQGLIIYNICLKKHCRSSWFSEVSSCVFSVAQCSDKVIIFWKAGKRKQIKKRF